MKVLYVDDDVDDAEIFREALAEIASSIECNLCTKYVEVMQCLKDGCPDYLFLDYRMPLLDGKEILIMLRAHHCFNAMKIIMYSTMMSDLDKEECKKLGAYECIQKSGDFATLCKTLKGVLMKPE